MSARKLVSPRSISPASLAVNVFSGEILFRGVCVLVAARISTTLFGMVGARVGILPM